MTAEEIGADLPELFGRLGRGDRAAFDALVQAFWDPIMRFFWKRVSADDAEDLTQGLFVAVYQSVRRGAGPRRSDAASWRRYLFTCAGNRLVDYWRRKACRPPTASLESLLDEGESWQDVIGSAEEADLAADAALLQEESEAIRECMGTLDVLSRTLCWLVFADGRSKREIARRVGKPEASVRAMLVEAIRALRRCLEAKGLAPSS